MANSDAFKLKRSDKTTLKRWLRSTTASSGATTRANIVLALDRGESPTNIGRSYHVTRKTIYKWKDRYLAEGIAGLEDAPRSGRPSVIDEKTIKKVLNLSTEYVPEEATHWSLRLMAKHASVSQWQVRQIWNAFDIRPHLTKTFKVSTDPHFAEKVIDIVGLYMNPPDNAVVLSVDEKTQIQALNRTQPGLPLGPGRIGSHTHDYKRHGTAALFAAFNTLTGQVIGEVSDRCRSKDFLRFLKKIERKTPKDKDLHVILDNLSAHKTKEVEQWLSKNPRVTFHFTPTSSSWLNAVEGWFAQLERRALYQGVFTSVKELKDELLRFVEVHNDQLAKPFVWSKPAKQILASVERVKKALPN